MKALGKRNQAYGEIESRKKKEQEIKILIREKRQELERMKTQYISLEKVEEDQKKIIEKLSNNETVNNDK